MARNSADNRIGAPAQLFGPHPARDGAGRGPSVQRPVGARVDFVELEMLVLSRVFASFA